MSRDLEHLIGIACMQWWSYEANRQKLEPELLYHIPNGGHRHKAVAGKLKASGVRAGVPDYFLAVARGGFHGLYIELKSDEGEVTTEQKKMLARLSDQGYQASIAWGTDDFINIVSGYLQIA